MRTDEAQHPCEPTGEVDETLIDEMLEMTPRERLLSNDRVLRTVEKLEQGFATVRSDRDPR